MRNSLDIWAWNPSGNFFGFTPVVDRLFEDLQTDARRVHSAAVLTPACDVEETPTHFLLSFDMPGIAKENINIEVVDDQLVVSGERRWEKGESQGNRHLSERSYG